MKKNFTLRWIVSFLIFFSFLSEKTFAQTLNVASSGSTTYTLCNSTLTVYDPGGTGDYPASCTGYTVIYPTVGSALTVTGTQTVEAGYDYVSLYRGVGTGGTRLYGGTQTGSGCSTYSTGSYTLSVNEALTVYFYSDGSVQCAGFTLTVTNSLNIGLETAAATANSACSNGTVPLGAGAYKDVAVIANTYYNFTAPATITNGDAMVITPLNGNATTVTLAAGQSTSNWASGTTTSIRVTNRRSNCTWAATSSSLTYRNSTPYNTTVSGGGTFCAGTSNTLTATGGNYGTIYWQGTTSGGTSTTTASSSQSVSTAGTYYFNSNNNGCWGTQGSATVAYLSAFSNGSVSTSGSTTICNNTAPTGISTAGATGSGSFTYQWYYQSGLVTPTSGSTAGWTVISGQTSAALTASAITGNTTYACWVTPGGSPSCGSANWAGSGVGKVQITVLPAVGYGTVSTSGATTICYNTAPTGISTSGATGSGSFTYQWYSQPGAVTPTSGSTAGWTAVAGQTTSSLTATAITANTTYACWVTPGGSPTCGSANWAGASNNDKIQITVLPTINYGTVASGNQSICYNATPASMSVSGATGSGSFTYQWYYQSGIVTAPTGSVLTGWTSLGTSDGANTATYTPTSGITASRTYACFVTPGGSPSCGTGTWATSARQVTVYSDFAGGTLASSAQTICYNTQPSSITYSVSPSGGTSLTYQWYKQSGSIAAPTGTFAIGSWTAVGTTTSSSTLAAATIGNLTATTTFACRVISGSSCFDKWAGNAHVVTVQSTPTAGSIGSDQTICNAGDPASFSSTSAGSGDGTITYIWQSSVSPFSSYSTISGQTASTYDEASGLTATTRYQRITVSTLNSVACQSSATSYVTVTVQGSVGAGTIGTDQTICNGSTPSALSSTAAGTGDAVSGYIWEVSTTSSSSGFSTIGGASASTYAPGSLTVDTWYRRTTVSTVNSISCQSSPTSAVKITVQSVPTSGTIAGIQTICYNTAPSTISSTGAGTGNSGATISYIWELSTTSSSSGFSTIGGATSNTYASSALTANTWFRRTTVATLNGTSCYSSPTTEVQVTVQSLPVSGSIGSNHTICYNATANSLTNSVSGSGDGTIAYRWEKSTTSSSSGFASVAGTGSTFSPGALTATTWYIRYTRSTVNGVTCESSSTTPVQVTVHLDLTTGTIGSDQTICNNTTPVSLTSSTSGTGSGTIAYQWQSSTTSSSTGFSDISGQTASTYAPSALTTTTWYKRLTNSTLNGVTCTSSTGPVVQITVQGVVSAGSIGTDQTVCYNTTPASLTSVSPGTEATSSGTITYTWEKSTISSSSGFSTIPSMTSSTYSPGALTTTTWYRRNTISTLNSVACSSSPTSIIEVTVRPQFTAGAITTSGETLCSNNDPSNVSSSIVASGGDNSITYEWRANGTPISSTNSASYDPPAISATTTYTRWAKDAICNTSFTQSTGSWVVTINNPSVSTSLTNGDYVWVGTTSTDWATTSNWLQWNSGTSDYSVPSSYPNSGSSNVILPSVGGCVLNTVVTGGNSLTVNDLTIESGQTLNLNNASATLSIAGAFSNSGTWSTPTSGSTVIYNGSGAQNILALNYSNLQTAGTGTKTLSGNISIPGVVTVGSSTTLALSSNSLTLSSTGTPLVLTGSLSSGTGTVNYSATGTQNIATANYYDLTISGSSNKSLTGTTSISNTLDLTAGTLVIGGNTLTFSGSSIVRTSGTIDGSNASATLIFNNSSDLTLPSSIFSSALNNLTLSGAKVKVSSDFTVNGTLNLNNSNPSDVDGILDLVQSYGSYADVHSNNSTDSYNDLNSVVLTLGPSSSVTGSGDVTGKVRRTSFTSGLTYAFGNANMQLTFTGSSLPSQITVVSTKGAQGLHVDKDDASDNASNPLIGGPAVKRMWQILKTGGSSPTTFSVRFPYLDSELNSNTEANLVTWDHHLPYAGMTPHEHGKTNINTTLNYVELTGHGIGYLATEGDAAFTKYWMLSQKVSTDTLWLGAAGGSVGTNWSTAINWSSGAVPSSTAKVVVDPTVYNNQLTITGSQSVGTFEIKPNGVVNGGSSTLTLNGGPAVNGGAGTWVNQGTFNPGTSTVIFNYSQSTLAGSNNFYNLTVNSGKTLTVQSSSVDTILGTMQVSGTLDAFSNPNTFVFSGESQSIPTPGMGYYNLTIDQQNDAGAVATGDLVANGNLLISQGSLDVDGNLLYINGDFINNGQLFNAPNVYFSGSGTQNIDGSTVTTFINVNVQDGFSDLHFNQDANFEGGLYVDGNSSVNAEAATLEFRNFGSPFYSIGTFTPGTSTVKYIGNDVTDIAVVDYHNLQLSGGSTMNVTGDVAVNGTLTIENVAVEIGSNKLSIADLVRADNIATINAVDGEIDFTNTSTLTIPDGVFSSTVKNLTDDGTAALTMGGDLTLTGTLALNEGVILMDGHKLTMEDGSTWNRTNGWLNPETDGQILFKTATLNPDVMPSDIVPNLEIDRIAGVTLTNSMEITGDFKMTSGTIDVGSHTLKLSGNMIYVSGGVDADNGTVDFNNSAVWNLPTGFFTGDVKGLMVSGTGGLGLADATKITNTLTMNGGDVTMTNDDVLEIGSSASNTGSINWSTGTIVGTLKRWFGNSTNSTQASGIFPIGLSNLNRSAQVNFTSSPSSGGYIVAKFVPGLAPDSYATVPIAYTENSANYHIQNTDEVGYWDITPYDASGNPYNALDDVPYTLKLRINNPWSISNGGILNDPPRIRLIRAKGNPDGSHNNWSLAGTYNTITTVTPGEDYIVTSNNVTGFSWFNGGGDNSNPLPVELLTFSGQCTEDGNQLSWQTASENKSAYFDVQASRNGEDWNSIKTVNAAGYSLEKLTYNVLDYSSVGSDLMYYRLRQVDIDNNEKLYDPIVISCNSDKDVLKSYPNPSNSSFNVLISNKSLVGNATLTMVDTKGTKVSSKDISIVDGMNLITLNQNLAPGIYYIEISNGSAHSEVIKHIIH